MSQALDDVPEVVAAALARLRDDLQTAAGANFAGLILFGGLARGRYRSGRSDVNLVLLLHDASGAALNAVAPALRAARRAVAAKPLVLALGEVSQAAEAFPIKFLDIQRHHRVLAGENPFATLHIPPAKIRQRIAQELQNLTLRLRNRFIAAGDDAQLLLQTLAGFARPVAIGLQALLVQTGGEVADEDRTAEIFSSAARAFALDAEALAAVAELRRRPAPRDDARELYLRFLAAVARCAARAGEFAEGHS